ncbi:MAG: outer membrane protein assembly factor BamD, partial [Bacteroidota bacterium]|nr:outer membrane protein assembly factor BamD [Bacteroidota bacterium]
MLKSDDITLKYQKAIEYYDMGKCEKAGPLLSDLLNYYRGTKEGEKLQYYYAMCQYNTGNYLLAAYHYKTYAETYPKGENIEDAYYMYAMSLY